MVEKERLLILQKLSFLEFVKVYGKDYVLIRPVFTFNVPQDKGFFFKYKFFPDLNNRNVAFRTVKRIFYKDGEKVKANQTIAEWDPYTLPIIAEKDGFI